MTLELDFKYGVQPEPPPDIDLPDNLYRVKHDIELPATVLIKGIVQHGIGMDVLFRKMKRSRGARTILWRKNVPEVFLLKPIHKVKLTREWQQLCWELFQYGAPHLSGDYAIKKFIEAHSCHRAFENNNGWSCKKPDPHGPFRNYITGENTGDEYNLPAFDKIRFCGGATVSVYEIESGRAWVSTLTEPIPIEQLKKEPWHYFHATTVTESGSIGKFPQGDGNPVYIPLASKEPVHYPLAYLEKVDHIADPYAI